VWGGYMAIVFVLLWSVLANVNSIILRLYQLINALFTLNTFSFSINGDGFFLFIITREEIMIWRRCVIVCWENWNKARNSSK
jgi:hypothetical protein